MAISKIKTKSLALSSVTSDIILNNTVKFIDLDPEVVTIVQDTKTLVQTNSANWNYQGTDLKALSGNWDSTYSTVSSLSSTWNYQGTDLKALSGNWESTYSTVQSNSATWNYQGTDLKSLSANWQSTYSVVSSLSGSWNTAFNTATSYQNVSSSFITNTLLQSTSSLLTPLILTNVLTGQLVTNTLFTEYQTTVSNITATLLPSSIYQNASGDWQTAYAYVSANSINLSATTVTVENKLTVTNSVSSKLYYGTLIDWMTLVRGFNEEPTLLQSTPDGEIYRYTYTEGNGNRIYYRYISADNTQDAFYETYVGDVLNNLIASKSISF